MDKLEFINKSRRRRELQDMDIQDLKVQQWLDDKKDSDIIIEAEERESKREGVIGVLYTSMGREFFTSEELTDAIRIDERFKYIEEK